LKDKTFQSSVEVYALYGGRSSLVNMLSCQLCISLKVDSVKCNCSQWLLCTWSRDVYRVLGCLPCVTCCRNSV